MLVRFWCTSLKRFIQCIHTLTADDNVEVYMPGSSGYYHFGSMGEPGFNDFKYEIRYISLKLHVQIS